VARGRSKVVGNETVLLVRFGRRRKLNLRTLIQLALLVLIVVLILKVLKVI